MLLGKPIVPIVSGVRVLENTAANPMDRHPLVGGNMAQRVHGQLRTHRLFNILNELQQRGTWS
jgi:hypothetical protein